MLKRLIKQTLWASSSKYHIVCQKCSALITYPIMTAKPNNHNFRPYHVLSIDWRNWPIFNPTLSIWVTSFCWLMRATRLLETKAMQSLIIIKYNGGRKRPQGRLTLVSLSKISRIRRTIRKLLQNKKKKIKLLTKRTDRKIKSSSFPRHLLGILRKLLQFQFPMMNFLCFLQA